MKWTDVEVNVKKYEPDEVILELPGEDHTLLNLLRWALNRHEGIIATYRVEHPVLGKRHKVEKDMHIPPVLRIKAVEDDVDAREILEETLDKVLEELTEARKEILRALEEADEADSG